MENCVSVCSAFGGNVIIIIHRRANRQSDNIKTDYYYGNSGHSSCIAQQRKPQCRARTIHSTQFKKKERSNTKNRKDWRRIDVNVKVELISITFPCSKFRFLFCQENGTRISIISLAHLHLILSANGPSPRFIGLHFYFIKVRNSNVNLVLIGFGNLVRACVTVVHANCDAKNLFHRRPTDCNDGPCQMCSNSSDTHKNTLISTHSNGAFVKCSNKNLIKFNECTVWSLYGRLPQFCQPNVSIWTSIRLRPFLNMSARTHTSASSTARHFLCSRHPRTRRERKG